MTATARIITDKSEDAIVAPLSAINGGSVQVYSSGKLTVRKVEIGKTDATHAEILS